MKLFHLPIADEERIAAFIDGTLSSEEMTFLESEIDSDDSLASFVADLKSDLETIDKGIQLEASEPDFDSNSAINSLFEESNKWPLFSSDDNFNSPIANVEFYLESNNCYESENFQSDSAMNDDDVNIQIEDDGGVSSPVIYDTND